MRRLRPIRPSLWCAVVLVALTLAALAGGCSVPDDATTTRAETSSADSPGPTASTSTTATTAETDTETNEDTTVEPTPNDAVPLSQTNKFNLLAPGWYTTDALSVGLEFTSASEFDVSLLLPGTVIIEAPSSTFDAYSGVGFFVVDTLLDSDTGALQRNRLPATADLEEFLTTRDGVEVTERRHDELGGEPARVWRIEYTAPCEGCSFETLFSKTGWQNLWGTTPGQVQELWTIDTPGSPIIVAVEAPEEEFDSWREVVHRDLFDDLRFGAPTGFSLQRPTGRFATGFGDYAVGRAEVQVVDPERPTMEVSDASGVIVPASDQRSLLLSVAYPSDQGGFGSAPAAGSFPLIVVAPALRDAAIILPADRQLASHGFVVVSIRFPESSFPGNAQLGVPHQPADVSFVLDQLERPFLPADVAEVTDATRIGLIGHSGGATTALGLLAYDCCQDERLDAIVAHAAVPYDFDSARVSTAAPILHVVSRGDLVAQVDAVTEFHEATNGPSSIVELDLDSHLGWLQPQASSYARSFEFVLAFLDRHLRQGTGDLAALAANSGFVAYDER